jgi:hypothetical protein
LDLQAGLEQSAKQVEEFRKLVQFLTIFHGVKVIDQFKKSKTD